MISQDLHDFRNSQIDLYDFQNFRVSLMIS